MNNINGIRIGRTAMVIALTACCLGVSAQTLLTMDRALDVAEENSPTLKRSHLNMERSKENLTAQRASLKSSFSLNLNPATYSNTRQYDNFNSEWYTSESFNTGGTFQISQPLVFSNGTVSLVNRFGWQTNKKDKRDPVKDFTNDLSLRLSQPLFSYNSTKMSLNEIQLDYENSQINYEIQRLNTERQITTQFYAMLMAQDRLSISENELENTQKNYDIVKDKVSFDLSAKAELYQAELNLANARSSLEDRKVALENAKDNLKQALGMPLSEDILVTAQIDFSDIDVDVNKAVDHALKTRLELIQRQITTERLRYQMIRTKALNEFKGSVDLSLGLSGQDKVLGDVYANPTQSPRVALSLNIPLFDWGEKKARIEAQQIAQQINTIDADEEVKDIEINVRQSYRNIINTKNQVSIAEQSVRNAQLTYDLNAEKYRTGDITGLDMSQYENQLSSAKISFSQAKINYKIELLNMKILTLYDFEKRVSIVPSISTDMSNSKK